MRPKIYQFNEDFFSRIESEPQAYFLGLLADGWLLYRKDEGPLGVAIDLSQEDSYILERWRELLGNPPPLMRHRNMSRLLLTSIRIGDDLLDLGLKRRKSDRVSLLKYVPNYLWNHLVRGWFDADGSLVDEKYRLRFWIRGPNQVLSELSNWLPVPMKLSWGIHRSLYTTRHQDAVELGNWLYQDATLFLRRKHDKFTSALARRRV